MSDTACPSESPYIYADPPYMLASGKNSLYGTNGDLHEAFDHVRFRDIIAESTVPWLLSYNDTPEVRNLYENYEILPATWSYGMNASKKSSEILITSYK
jgi:DNA adenine methylase